MSTSYVSGLIGRLQPFEDKPRAEKVLETDTAHVVVFEFAAGQDLSAHKAHHAIVVQTIAGHVTFESEDGVVDLRPGDLVHVPGKMIHAVHAVEDSTITVTMIVKDDVPT